MANVAEKPSLTLVRKFNAPPAKVWQAWTDPAVMARWIAPSDAFSITVAEADVRVGGRYRFRMEPPQGEANDVSGVYREVVPVQRLVFTWAWASSPERESLVTVELRGLDGRTELTLKHEQFFDDAARDRHGEGWGRCLGRLEPLLS
jgi:uncharacterized protein YndB with AHSA1/START domain